MTAGPTHSGTGQWFLTELSRWGQTLRFNPTDIVADLVAMVAAYPDPAEHYVAIAETVHQLEVISKRQPGTDMYGRLTGWRRDSFQSDRRSVGVNADLRIVYRMSSDQSIELLALGTVVSLSTSTSGLAHVQFRLDELREEILSGHAAQGQRDSVPNGLARPMNSAPFQANGPPVHPQAPRLGDFDYSPPAGPPHKSPTTRRFLRRPGLSRRRSRIWAGSRR
jgi:hypothetical protein